MQQDNKAKIGENCGAGGALCYNWSMRKLKRSQVICFISYLIVPVFFVVLYLAMTMNYEDLYQREAYLDDSVGTVLDRIYHWLPRTGEIWQRLAVHLMTPQLSFGWDLVFRLAIAAMASGLVYLLTVFVLGRRPRLAYRDAFIFLGLFICLILLGTSEIFTFNFSYTHNYVISGLLMVAFALPYRLGLSSRHPAVLIGMLILGALLGLASEIIPVALLIIFAGFAIWQLVIHPNLRSVREFWRRYRLQIIGAIGLICGLIIYYLGVNLSSRTDGGYSVVYDYVSPLGIFSDPIITIGKLVRHFFYNIRGLHFAIILMAFIMLLEYVNYRQKREQRLALLVGCFVFCVLYVGATSILAMHDDIYVRLMAPVYITVYASVWLYASRFLLSRAIFSERAARNFWIIATVVGVLMVGDLSYAMIRYNIKARPYLQDITVDEGFFPVFDSDLVHGAQDMSPSPLFQFQQSSPFHWVTDE